MNEQEKQAVDKKILREQLTLLAERSKECEDCYLKEITDAMVSVADYLTSN